MGFGKDGTGAIVRENSATALGALAANVTIKLATLTLGEDFRILKSEIFSHIEGLTAGQGIGLLLGIANNELSVTEIAAAVNNNGPTDLNDRVSQELSERNVKILSSALLLDSGGISRQFIGDDGGPKTISKHRWTYSNPEGWCFFIHNDGQTLTTGATCRIAATHFGMWVK